MEAVLKELQEGLHNDNLNIVIDMCTVKVNKEGKSIRQRFNDEAKALKIVEQIRKEGRDEEEEKKSKDDIIEISIHRKITKEEEDVVDDEISENINDLFADVITEVAEEEDTSEIDRELRDVFSKYEEGAKFNEAKKKVRHEFIKICSNERKIKKADLKEKEKRVTDIISKDEKKTDEVDNGMDTAGFESGGKKKINAFRDKDNKKIETDEETTVRSLKGMFTTRFIIITVSICAVVFALLAFVVIFMVGGEEKGQQAGLVHPTKIVLSQQKAIENKSTSKQVKHVVIKRVDLNKGKPVKVQLPTTAASQTNHTVDIKAFLMDWKTAWERTAGSKGDINTYMTYFADDFYANGLDKEGWKQDKKNKNSRKDWIRISLSDIKLKGPVVDNTVIVSFIQDFNSSNYSERSVINLKLSKEASGWKILFVQEL